MSLKERTEQLRQANDRLERRLTCQPSHSATYPTESASSSTLRSQSKIRQESRQSNFPKPSLKSLPTDKGGKRS